MFDVVSFVNDDSDSKIVSLCKIPISNPPYQTSIATQITTNTIFYEIIENGAYALIAHSFIGVSRTMFNTSISVISSTQNLDITSRFGYTIEDNICKPLVKIEGHYSYVKCFSPSEFAYASRPKIFSSLTHPVLDVQLKQINNLGCAVNSQKYYTNTIKAFQYDNISATFSKNYTGIVFGTNLGVVPFCVENGTLHMSSDVISGVYDTDTNNITFTASKSSFLTSVVFY